MQILKVAFVVVLGVVGTMSRLTEEQHRHTKMFALECQDELGSVVSPDFASRMSHEMIVLNDEGDMCHVQCIFLKIGVVHPDGEANEKGVFRELSAANTAEKAQLVTDLCLKQVGGTSKCSKAYSLYECYHQNKHMLL